MIWILLLLNLLFEFILTNFNIKATHTQETTHHQLVPKNIGVFLSNKNCRPQWIIVVLIVRRFLIQCGVLLLEKCLCLFMKFFVWTFETIGKEQYLNLIRELSRKIYNFFLFLSCWCLYIVWVVVVIYWSFWKKYKTFITGLNNVSSLILSGFPIENKTSWRLFNFFLVTIVGVLSLSNHFCFQ